MQKLSEAGLLALGFAYWIAFWWAWWDMMRALL
jgi:hypothetical protein